MMMRTTANHKTDNDIIASITDTAAVLSESRIIASLVELR